MPIATMRLPLTQIDVRALIKGPTEADRAQAAHKICRCIGAAELSPEERAHAESIMGVIAQDAAVLVRRALAVALKGSPRLPRHIANKLARDAETIALPIILSSPALTDSDLVEIVRAGPPAKQMAVASREALSPVVTGAIAVHATCEAVERALANDDAVFAEEGLDAALARFKGKSSVARAMVRRSALPVSIAEKLLSLVTGELFDHLVNNHELPAQIAIDLAMGSRERAALDIVEQAGRQRDVARFVQQLNLNGRLTPSLLMRGLCLGNIEFVEHAMAELGGVSHQRMRRLMHDSGPPGLKAAFDRAGLPPRFYPSFRAAMEVYHSVDCEIAPEDRIGFRRRMLERTLTRFLSMPNDDLDYLLEKLGASGRAAAV